MGRPRKRQFIEATKDDPVPNPDVDPVDLVPLPFVADDLDAYNVPVEPYFVGGHSALALPSETTVPGSASKTGSGNVVWYFGDRGMMGGPPVGNTFVLYPQE